MLKRNVIRVLLGLALAASMIAIVFAIVFPTAARPEVIAVLAAALAVIPAVLATWSGQRMVELEEDSRVPFPYPTFDVRSRYLILQLRMSNCGGGIARNVHLEWSRPLRVRGGDVFPHLSKAAPLPALLPNESVSFFVDSSREFVNQHGLADFTGLVHFEDATGHAFSHPFVLSSNQFKASLTFDDESLKAKHELQKIPVQLQEIGAALKGIGESFDRLSDRVSRPQTPRDTKQESG